MKSKLSLYMLQPKTVNILFFLMLASLPLVNKFSKFTVVLFLIVFFKFLYEYKDFILPRSHKLFLYAFFTLIVLSNILAGKMFHNLKKDLYLLIFILIYIAINYFVQKKVLKISTIIYAIIIPMTIYMIDGYYQYYTGYDLFFHHPLTNGGINSVSRNRNLFALASFFYFVVLFYLSFERKEKHFLIYLLLGFSFIGVFLTLSRQMWIAVLVFLFIMALFKYRTITLRHSIIVLLSIVVLFAVLFSLPEVQHRLADLENMQSAGRVEFWSLLITHVPDAPIFGHSMQSPMNIEGEKENFLYAHNLTLGVLYNFGIVGLVLYFSFILYFLKKLFVCPNQIIKPYFLATFIAILFVQQQLGGSMLIHKFIGPSIMIFLALLTSYCGSESFVKKVKTEE